MKSQVVLDVGLGDSGKGKVVSSLCGQHKNPLVIRFSGGHQAGHHVMLKDGREHVFSNFGSGSMQGFDTYWSEYCTVDPVGIINELEVLKTQFTDPRNLPMLYINGDCPITTPYDKQANVQLEEIREHGTCGVGFGETWQREENHFHLKFSDLFNPTVFKIKLNAIMEYYFCDKSTDINNFLNACDNVRLGGYVQITDGFPWEPKPYLSQFGSHTHDAYIFEGSQGLLLDQDIGFFPHVTRSNTDTTNILKMGFKPEITLVTRAYQTRHGNGPMVNEHLSHNIKVNPYEQNKDSGAQGKFRIAPLSLDLIKYAIDSDKYIKNKKDKELIITCVDLVDTKRIQYSCDGNVKTSDLLGFLSDVGNFLDIYSRNIIVNRSPITGEL